MKTKIEIKSKFGQVLFEYEKENNTIKDTLVKAVRSGADLHGADLGCADLCSAYLDGANLHGAILDCADLAGATLSDADLRGVNLVGANLSYANLGSANLSGANLSHANLRGVNLYGANLSDADLSYACLHGAEFGSADLGDLGKLSSKQDVLIVGVIGSRNYYVTIFHTDKGVFVQYGCFNVTLDEFASTVKEAYSGTKDERDYLALVEFAKIKFGL